MSDQDYKDLLSKFSGLINETNKLSKNHEQLLISNSQMILVANKYVQCQRNMETLNSGENHKRIVLQKNDNEKK